MIQDMVQGRLENEFYIKKPDEGDYFLFFKGNDVLIKNDGADCGFPELRQVRAFVNEDDCIYLFSLEGRAYFMTGDLAAAEPEGFFYTNVRQLYTQLPKELCFAAMTGKHLYFWYKSNRFCGSCGERTQRDTLERMLRCPACGNMIYPRINPAVIIGVTDGSRLLMSKYAGRLVTRYALIAGYTEIGETLEQTVRREVKEETGLDVCNIRYYKSQPWGVDGNILAGFFCELQGDDKIRLDENELSFAGWFEREDIPSDDKGISLTEEMIRVFKNSEI